ncbi:unnamed protein product [Schistocephalus solidus]|uniref:Proteasome assembly chaperone 3 n=1 Tax=Schistocephalus solidus TaxID=70667 RepID=A0A183SMN8_SCHSO|nr:unnamed protein product [Schistocephalus solidus]
MSLITLELSYPPSLLQRTESTNSDPWTTVRWTILFSISGLLDSVTTPGYLEQIVNYMPCKSALTIIQRKPSSLQHHVVETVVDALNGLD